MKAISNTKRNKINAKRRAAYKASKASIITVTERTPEDAARIYEQGVTIQVQDKRAIKQAAEYARMANSDHVKTIREWEVKNKRQQATIAKLRKELKKAKEG